MLENVNIKAAWKSGYYRVLSMMPEEVVSEIEELTLTFCCPIKRGVAVGVKSIEVDWSLEDVILNEDEDDSTEMIAETTDDKVTLSEIIPDPNQVSELFFLINGKRVYKSSCLKAISKSQKLSKDRLRRVQGMRNIPGGLAPIVNPDSLLLSDDPVLVNIDGQLKIAVVKILKQNVSLSEIDFTTQNNKLENIEFVIMVIDTELVDEKLFYKGTTSGEKIRVVADRCLPIRPNITLDPPGNLSKYFFDINVMQDMGVNLQITQTEQQQERLTQTTAGPSVVSKPCFNCGKVIPWSDMRKHVAVHILNGDLSGNICGFCGKKDLCMVTMKATSKKGAKKIYTLAESDCVYTYMYGRSKKFNKKSNPCTNRVERCPINECLSNVWKYNFPKHITDKHVDFVDIPEEMLISEDEKIFLLKL